MCSRRQATLSASGLERHWIQPRLLPWLDIFPASLSFFFALGAASAQGTAATHKNGVCCGLGSTTQWQATSSLRPPTRLGSKSRSRNVTFVVIRPLTCRHFLHSPTCSVENSTSCASCAEAGTEVDWESTLAETHGQRKRRMKTTQEDDAENLGVGTRGQGQTAPTASLRPDECMRAVTRCDEGLFPVLSFISRGGLVWPPKEQGVQEREVDAQGGQERRVEAQGGHEDEGEETTREESVEEKGGGTNSPQEKNHVSNRHMTWWQKSWWVRIDNGPHLRTARGRRQAWRAATRAAREMCVTEETQCESGEIERERLGKWRRGESNTLHIVLHLPTNTTPATATATVQQQQCQQQRQLQ